MVVAVGGGGGDGLFQDFRSKSILIADVHLSPDSGILLRKAKTENEKKDSNIILLDPSSALPVLADALNLAAAKASSYVAPPTKKTIMSCTLCGSVFESQKKIDVG